MAVCADQPPQGFVGDFIVGERVVGDVKYKDAICGGPICAQAICGMWWAYVCAGPLELGGLAPDLLVNEVPAAAYELHAQPPALILDSALAVPETALGLLAEAPALVISSLLASPDAGLGLGGGAPHFVGQAWLNDLISYDKFPLEAPCSDLVLVGASVTTIDLDPEVCR